MCHQPEIVNFHSDWAIKGCSRAKKEEQGGGQEDFLGLPTGTNGGSWRAKRWSEAAIFSLSLLACTTCQAEPFIFHNAGATKWMPMGFDCAVSENPLAPSQHHFGHYCKQKTTKSNMWTTPHPPPENSTSTHHPRLPLTNIGNTL